jgi:hypothetical protein
MRPAYELAAELVSEDGRLGNSPSCSVILSAVDVEPIRAMLARLIARSREEGAEEERAELAALAALNEREKAHLLALLDTLLRQGGVAQHLRTTIAETFAALQAQHTHELVRAREDGAAEERERERERNAGRGR